MLNHDRNHAGVSTVQTTVNHGERKTAAQQTTHQTTAAHGPLNHAPPLSYGGGVVGPLSPPVRREVRMTAPCPACRRPLSPEHAAAGLSEHRHHTVQDAALNAVTTGFCASCAAPSTVYGPSGKPLCEHCETTRSVTA